MSALFLWSYSVLWSPTLLQTIIFLIFLCFNNLFVTITWPPPSFHLTFWLICNYVKQHKYQCRAKYEMFLYFKSWCSHHISYMLQNLYPCENVSFHLDSLISLRGFDKRLCKMFENQIRLHQLNVSCQYAYQLVQQISLDFCDVSHADSSPIYNF